MVRGTGTEFDVRETSGEKTEVTVLAGTVHVRASGAAATDEALAPGRQAVMCNGHCRVRQLPMVRRRMRSLAARADRL